MARFTWSMKRARCTSSPRLRPSSSWPGTRSGTTRRFSPHRPSPTIGSISAARKRFIASANSNKRVKEVKDLYRPLTGPRSPSGPIMAGPLPNLDTFSRAAELSSFTAAARALGLTQAAVSQRVQALEKVLGTSLFIRQGGGVLLTEAGQKLYEYAQQ